MGLNIKSDEAHRLAKRLAEQTGESLTTAVTMALQERLARVEKDDRIARLTAISKRCAKHLAEGPGEMMKIEDLYDDETGLPK